MSQATDITTDGAGPGPASRDPQRWSRRLTTAIFLGPAVVLLGVWLVYPTFSTIYRSFFDKGGDKFVGFDNYVAIFSTENLTTALQNNVLWVAIVPALITAIGLVLAVMTEKVRWQVAFRLAVFMPMAISLFAAGVIWRIMDDQDPAKGTLNASIGAVKNALGDNGGILTRAKASTDGLTGDLARGFVAKATVQPGGAPVFLGLTGIPPVQVPKDAVDGNPQSAGAAPAGSVTGTVWRDFKPGGGEPGVVEAGELGITGATVELRDGAGKVAQTTTAKTDGSFTFSGLSPGDYKVAIAAKTFEEPFTGVSWLGPKLINPAIMIAYIWVWAGFSMVIIAAGWRRSPVRCSRRPGPMVPRSGRCSVG